MVLDGSTHKSLFGVSISNDTSSKGPASFADGNYLLNLRPGTYTIIYSLNDFQTKLITNVTIRRKEVTYLDVFLFPISKKILSPTKKNRDSLNIQDSAYHNSFYKESGSRNYNISTHLNGLYDIVSTNNIQAGVDKNAAQLLKRLNGIIVQDCSQNDGLQSLNVFGFGDRYNQLLLDHATLNTFDPANRSYPLELLPTEAIEKASVQKTGNSSLPADFSGGTIEIKTKDLPDQNFFYVQAGTGFSDATIGKNFYSDKRNNLEWLSFPGTIRDLPSSFPTTRSQYALNQKNPQEQVYQSMQLNNNLEPISYGSSKPNEKILLGFGRLIPLKHGEKIGILAFLNQQQSQLINESVVQVSPDVVNNPYPFNDNTKAVIRSLSNDISYHYNSHLTGIVNASMIFGKNKISFKSFFGSQFSNIYVNRSQVSKPDEDTLSHNGINYITTQRKFLNVQLSGEHALGGNGKFKMNWQASYGYYREQDPDGRAFLLRQDSVNNNTFELAHQSDASLSSVDAMFTNSGRMWRDFNDNNFTGSINIHVPFNMLNLSQSLSGGVYIQSRYRVFHSDLLLTQGPGYYSLDKLLAPERYFPRGLSVTNYYNNVYVASSANNYSPDATNRGNYTASANLGAAYISLENHLTNFLSLQWGLRVESNSQLVSNTQYKYFNGFRNPRIIPLDENTRVTEFSLLPSVNLIYQPIHKIELHAAYFRTVNRPQLQELSAYRIYDARSFLVRTGNPILANSLIDNFDAGVRWFAGAQTNISVSGFYKKIDQPIENILSLYANNVGNLISTPYNNPPANVYGLNAAFKINFDFISSAPWLSYFSIFGNGNWLKSKVDAGPLKSLATPNVAEHSLSGMPDYSVNGGLVFQHPLLPMITILYNRIGDYISEVGSGAKYTLVNGNNISAIPDYRVKARDQLDIQISQKLFKSRIQIIAGVNNLSNSAYIEYQDLNGNKKFDAPLSLASRDGHSGFFESGIDNTVVSIKSQRTYYITISYLFK